MHQMEGFQYVISLDTNMVYYDIRIEPTSHDMTTIVTEFGKFRYNCLSMGICALGVCYKLK